MMMFGEALFRKSELSDYLRQQAASIEQHVGKNVREADLSEPDEMIVSKLLEQAVVSPLHVDFENPTKDAQEHPLLVSDGFGGTVKINGVRATRAFAFTGDKNLFELRPNRWGDYPRGELRRNLVVVGVEGRPDAELLKQEMDRQETALREYVSNSTAEINVHNEALAGKILDAVKRRRAQLSKIENLKDLL
ncbi:hypothetical protein M2322_004418 [Rhodoblastus acidophilus]|uniref:hypothetical protein n=1 Tax=Rhodoblastus acidophilus TaxID=1074 RepID=UPI002225894D|nr:hypothetical protein [Rhodoblastus acidophilus]MCW2318849.1 hypothetical protein [Rhodoblastus acidophilus]